jgi:RNA polymerase sigma-70 factor (ECF subfamily)
MADPNLGKVAQALKEVPDDRLVAGCIDGDALCWETLYRRYYGYVRRVVAWPRWRFTPSEVEDYTQEVFLELMRALPGFRGEASLSTFLTRLAKNRCVSQIRRKTALKRVREEVGYALEERKGNSDEPLAIAVAEGPLPDEQIVQREEAAELLQALQQLSADCQSILTLRYYKEQSYDEICGQLGLPLGTVCSRLKRCLERLKKVMSP